MTTFDLTSFTRRSFLALSGVGLAAATFPQEIFAQSRGNILIIASGQDIPNFDPHTATGYSASFFLRNTYDPLVRVSGNPPEAVPALAQSWEASEDGKTYTFALNPAAVFHDGTPVTAADVVFSYQRALRLAQGNSWMIRDIVTPEGITAVDDHTVRFDLANSFAAFLQVVPWIFIVSKAAAEANAGTDDSAAWLQANVAGSGPFKLGRAEAGTLYQLERAETAWQSGGGNLDGVIWQIVRETATQRLMLQRGEVHMALDLTTEDMDSLADAAGVVRVIEPEYRTFSIKMNTQHGPMADINMRKAVAYAMNYQGMLEAAGYADLMVGPLPTGILGHNPDLVVYRTDLEKAKEHLAKTVTPTGGITLKIMHVTGLEQQRRWALILLDSLKHLGIDLEIIPMNWPDMVTAAKSPETFPDFFPVYQTANYADPDNIAYAAYHSSRNGGWQNAVYKNPEADKLIETGRTETDPAKRIAIYGQLQELLVADCPDIFGVLEKRKLGLRDSVQNFVFSPVAANAVEAWPLSI